MPLKLVGRVLGHAGALVEPAGDGALEALLPPELAAAWSLPEHALLAADGRPGSIPCGHGSALLRATIEHTTASGATAVVRASLTPPRPGPPGAYAGLNVALRPGAPVAAEAWTLTAHLRLDASADDRRLVPLTTSVALEECCWIPTPSWGGIPLEPFAERPPAELLARAEAPLSRAALRTALEALDGFREAVARRCRRDALRIDRYFVELDEDLRRRAERSPADRSGQGQRAKRAALPPERARRLTTLRDDATLRGRLEVVALLLVRVPVAQAPLEVLRRRRRRVVEVRWHPVLRAWLPLACEGCGEPTRSIGACDDEVHLLCQTCVEARRCPRCERGAPLPATSRLHVAGAEEVVRVAGPACGDGLDLPASGAPAPVVAPRAAGVGPAPTDKVTREAPPRRGGGAAPSPVASSPVASSPVASSPVASSPVASSPVQSSLFESPPVVDSPAPAPAPASAGSSTGALVAFLRAAAGRPLAASDVQAATGLGPTALRAALAPLIASGQVERTGQTRGTRYTWRGP